MPLLSASSAGPLVESVPSFSGASRAVAEIRLSALQHNLAEVRRIVGPRVGVIAMVKCDAYGHGAVPAARALLEAGAQALGVATAEEALALRETAGLAGANIVVLAPTAPDDAVALQEADIHIAVGTPAMLRYHLEVAESRGVPARLHLQIDTGLGRDGIRWHDLPSIEALLQGGGAACIEGVCTHFACSDSPLPVDTAFTNEQRERFERIVRGLYRIGVRPVIHAANSGAILHHPNTHFEMVRPGLLLYGAQPGRQRAEGISLEPALTLRSRLVSVKEMLPGDSVSYGRLWTVPTRRRIGIVSFGYGDGYKLGFTNKGTVLVRGTRVPVRGRICMDMFMVDLSEVPDAEVGDEVVLYGRQGDEVISLEEAAQTAGTIPYDLTCSLGPRVARRTIG